MTYDPLNIILCGDFNFPNIQWGVEDSCSNFLGYVPPAVRSIIINLMNVVAYLELQQLYPNHPNKQYSLDLFFAHPSIAKEINIDEELIHSDEHHKANFFEITCGNNDSDNSLKSSPHRNFFKADYTKIYEDLSMVDWDHVIDANSSLDDNVSKFYNILNSKISDYVPYNKKNSDHQYPKWYNTDLIDCVIAKKEAHCTWKQSELPADKRVFSKLRAQCLRMSRKLHSQYIEDLENKINTNSKVFWKYANALNSSGKIPTTMKWRDRLLDNGQDIVNSFAKNFQGVYNSSNFIIMIFLCRT